MVVPGYSSQSKGKLVKVTITHYRIPKGKAGGSGDQSRSFKYNGIHWANPAVSYKVDVDGSNTDAAAAINAVTSSFDTWENEINNVGQPDNSSIDYTYDTSAIAQKGAVLNGENTVSWDSIATHGVIAQTTYWYYTATKELAEFDIVMNKGLSWATNGSSTAFDIQNIATHEAGHTLVLLDLYKSRDKSLTMYGYSAPGETAKRDLGLGDCLGLETIY